MEAHDVVLETPRLILRPWREDDAHALFIHAQNPLIGPACGWEPHRNEAESLSIIHSVLMRPETYAVTLKESSHPDAPIGSVGLKGPAISKLVGPSEVELGYWIAVKLWGHGIATEAVGRVGRHAFEDLGLKKIWAQVLDDNERSLRVLHKLGMKWQRSEQVESPWGPEDKEIYSLDRTQWLERVYR